MELQGNNVTKSLSQFIVNFPLDPDPPVPSPNRQRLGSNTITNNTKEYHHTNNIHNNTYNNYDRNNIDDNERKYGSPSSIPSTPNQPYSSVHTPSGARGSPSECNHGYSDTQISGYGIPGRTREDGGSAMSGGRERSYTLHLNDEVIY